VTYTVTIATEATRDLVVEALRAAAEQRTRVARGAARTVAATKAADPRADVRSRSVKVTALLAEAGDLDALATEVAALESLVVMHVDAHGRIEVEGSLRDVVEVTEGGVTTTVPAPDVDDGTSEEAQALAELAGLKPSDPDAVEDPVTGALPEDEPTEPVEVLT
jgi:hypothetical protein